VNIFLKLKLVPALTLFALSLLAATVQGQQAVPQLDLARYTGNWFEIARTPNFWQRQCVADVVTHYELQPGDKFTIHNTCTKSNGKTTTGDGFTEGQSNGPGTLVSGKLRTSFLRPFYFDYWVIALDPEYKWAVVAEPNRKNIWIIARTPSISPATRTLIDQQISHAGFDPKTLINSIQTSATTTIQSASNH